MGLNQWQQEQHQQAQALREEARRLKREGLPVKEIARRLDRSEARVLDYLWEPKPRLPAPSNAGAMQWREKARLMAAVYDDPKARAWVLRQMGAEE